MKKSIFIGIVVALLGVATIGVAQSSWNGTSWISAGSTVSSEQLKGNLDFLYDNKAPKPSNCNGSESFLGWANGGWTCAQIDQPDSCTFNGNTIADGDAVTAYRVGGVPFGSTCESQQRTCSNGVLSGTYQQPNCTVAGADSCTFDGNTVAHGDSVTAYGAYSVPYGSSCTSERRTCTNGVLSGTNQAASCSVTQPSACAFGTSSVANGGEVTAYQAATVPFGSTCQSETRSCTNGVLSGSYEAEACSVAPASTCVFDGVELQNGQAVTAYESEAVPYGSSCVSEQRTCGDGTLSGSYEAVTCEVSRQDPVTFRQEDFIVSSTQYYCWNPDIFGGGTETPRDANNQCPGPLSFERTRTSRAFMNHPGIRYGSGSTGIGHDGLASDATTLQQLCEIKGYQYLIGHAERNRQGFREFKSPGNNRLVYGTAGQNFRATGVTINQTFNGHHGYVTCSDSPRSSGGGGGNGGGGGGGGNDDGRNTNLR